MHDLLVLTGCLVMFSNCFLFYLFYAITWDTLSHLSCHCIHFCTCWERITPFMLLHACCCDIILASWACRRSVTDMSLLSVWPHFIQNYTFSINWVLADLHVYIVALSYYFLFIPNRPICLYCLTFKINHIHACFRYRGRYNDSILLQCLMKAVSLRQTGWSCVNVSWGTVQDLCAQILSNPLHCAKVWLICSLRLPAEEASHSMSTNKDWSSSRGASPYKIQRNDAAQCDYL